MVGRDGGEAVVPWSGIPLSEKTLGMYLYACFKRACAKQENGLGLRFLFKRGNGQCLDGRKLHCSNARWAARGGKAGHPMSDAELLREIRRCAFTLI